MLVNTKARVGVFSIALGAYLPQFPSLVPEFESQYAAFKKTLPDTVEVIDGGMVTTKEQAMEAGDKFRAADVDLVFLQMLTYATSYNMLPAIRDLDVPVVLVNVQKLKALDYEHTDIASWLGEGYACGAVGEAVADLERAGKRHAVITGVVEGGDPGVQAEIEDWCKAAQVRRRFRDTNIAQIGRPYPGMMDLYIDETNLYNRMFLYTKQFDWEKMWAIADDITDEAQKIIDYLEDGGKAIIFSNYTVEDMPNFDSILADYGVEREKGIILEGDSDKYMSYQYCLVPDISYSAITENVYGNGSVLAPMSQGILTSDSHRDSITYQPLLTTSDASYSKEDVENMTTSEKEKGDKSGPFTIGMLIQEDTNNDDEADTEIVYYSTGYLLESNYNQAVSGSNAQLLGGTVNYLCNGEKTSAAVQTKSLQVKYLTLTDRAANIWTAICVFTLPLLFIIAGLAVWASRRKR